MSDAYGLLKNALSAYRGLVDLMCAAHEPDFNVNPQDLYFLMEPIRSQFEEGMELLEEEEADPGFSALQAKWKGEKQQLEKRQQEESRALFKIKAPHIPKSSAFADDSPETFERVKSILENASQPERRSGVE